MKPDALGAAYEATLSTAERRRGGAHYTPPAVADRLVTIALDGIDVTTAVCDPACGGGAFLLAAARLLHGRGVPKPDVLRLLRGIDVDSDAVAVTEAALTLWAGEPPPPGTITTGDALDGATTAAITGRCDAVVGNPPFLNQLERATVRRPSARWERFGAAAGGYADTAGLFLLAALDLVRIGGRVVLVQPASLLAARDAGPVRRGVSEHAALEGLWVAGEPVFAASVRVCAPVLRRGEPQPAQVERWVGAGVSPAGRAAYTSARTWSPMAAPAASVPDVRLSAAGTLGELATATAGFRDQFYGLVPFVDDRRPGGAPLVTCGLVEPGRVAWGERPTRFAGRRLDAPTVDVERLMAAGDPKLAAWVAARLVPKVVVATQTRVVEAAVDAAGAWVPSTPVISVHAPEDRLAEIAAVLLAPPVTAWALRTYGGTALADGAIKLSARQVLEVPLPSDRGAWREAAALVTGLDGGAGGRATLEAIGAAMVAAYRVDDGYRLLGWWAARLPFPADGPVPG